MKPIQTTDLPQNIDDFLLQVEQKAYRMALFSMGQHADAIDVLQDSMFKWAVKYADKPKAQWKPLFYRVLQNKIIDWQRQQKVKNMLFFWKTNQDEHNQQQQWAWCAGSSKDLPDKQLAVNQQQQRVLQELTALSDKQRQCFLLRSWEGLSVADTANIMGCSQGSVKTHYFRAVNKLRTVLKEAHDITI